jgi:hypothetical protein
LSWLEKHRHLDALSVRKTGLTNECLKYINAPWIRSFDIRDTSIDPNEAKRVFDKVAVIR